MLAARFRLSNRVAAMTLFPLAQRWPHQTASPTGRRSVGAKTAWKEEKRNFREQKFSSSFRATVFGVFFKLLLDFLNSWARVLNKKEKKSCQSPRASSYKYKRPLLKKWADRMDRQWRSCFYETWLLWWKTAICLYTRKGKRGAPKMYCPDELDHVIIIDTMTFAILCKTAITKDPTSPKSRKRRRLCKTLQQPLQHHIYIYYKIYYGERERCLSICK
jgi:hypothetical protein